MTPVIAPLNCVRLANWAAAIQVAKQGEVVFCSSMLVTQRYVAFEDTTYQGKVVGYCESLCTCPHLIPFHELPSKLSVSRPSVSTFFASSHNCTARMVVFFSMTSEALILGVDLA